MFAPCTSGRIEPVSLVLDLVVEQSDIRLADIEVVGSKAPNEMLENGAHQGSEYSYISSVKLSASMLEVCKALSHT
jgi:hypothetical protein